MALKKNKTGIFSKIPGLTTLSKKSILRGLVLFLLVLTAFAHLRSAFLAQLAMNKGANMASFSQTLTHPDALAFLARNEHYTNGNLPRSLALYQQALNSFALHPPSWMGVIELFNDMGEKNKALGALQFVQNFTANSEETSWAKALLAHEMDNEKILQPNLIWLAENSPNKRREVFALADLRWHDPAILMQHFAPPLHEDLLDYYIRTNSSQNCEIVWAQLAKSGAVSTDTALKYINFLLRQDDLQQAAALWRQHYQKDGNLLYNGALKEPFVASAFDWRLSIRDKKGGAWQPLTDQGGVRITFNGTENVVFELTQTVPLTAGEYILKGFLKTDGLTTDQLPSWSVTGYKCQGPDFKKEEMLPPTSERHEFHLPFTVADSCNAVSLSLRRNTSYFFDNKLAGTIELEGLSIEQQAGPPLATIQPENKKTAQPETKPSTKADIYINKLRIH